MHLQPLAKRERVLTKVANEAVAGRLRMAAKIGEMAEATKRRHAALLAEYEALIRWARKPLSPEVVLRLLGE